MQPAGSNGQVGRSSTTNHGALPHDLSLMPAGLEPEKTTEPKTCGLGKRKFQALLGVLALVAIGLVIGLGAGLTVGKRHSHESGQPDVESYRSKDGAWNGSGFALTDQGYIFHVYFQHHSGDLTWMYHNMEWYGDEQYVIATDARNNTSVSAVTYVSNATEFVHVFYIDSDNVVRQLASNNGTNGAWRRGPLDNANLHAYDADRVAMQVCWAGLSGKIAMRLWFASDNDTLEEYLWVDRSDNDNGTGYDDWVWQQSRPGYDLFAGIGCHNGGPIYSGGPDLPVIVTLVDSQSELEISTMSTAEALAQLEQVNVTSAWTKKTAHLAAINKVQSSKIAELLFVQGRDSHAIYACNFGWADDDPVLTANSSYSLGDDSTLSGTYFDVVTDPFAGIRIGYQINGSDITVSECGSSGIKEWSVPIYDDGR